MANFRMFRAFDSRNYRLFFFGQLVSLTGLWMANMASLWLIYHLSNSAVFLGLAGLCSQLPSLLLAPFAGVWVDRLNRHRLLLTTQSLSMLVSFALSAFALSGTIRIEHILVLSVIQGLITSFDMPARHALVFSLIEDKKLLGNAIALNSSMFNLGRLLGPAVAGFVIARYGAGVCYLSDGLSYVAVIGSLLAMRLPHRVGRISKKHPLREMQDGLRYVGSHFPIRSLLGLMSVISFWGVSVAVLAPVFAREILHGNAQTLGLLMAAEALGAFLGAIYLGVHHRPGESWRMILLGGLIQGAGLFAFSFSNWLPASMLFLGAVGGGGILVIASNNTLVQTLVDDDKRGRVMSLFTMAFQGSMPVGNLAIGSLMQTIGVRPAVWVSGSMCLMAALAFGHYLPRLRRAAADRPAAADASVLLNV